jgi:putative glutamine amidotransferase
VIGPLVAVVCYHLASGRVTGWERGAFAVPDTYVSALRRAGARPVLVAGHEDHAPEDGLEPFDGLLLAGGGDVAPNRYGAPRHPEVYGEDPDRDDIEVALARAAAERHVPTLAICRGIQVLNVAFGGTLHQHLPDVSGAAPHGMPRGAVLQPVVHEVEVAESSRLFAATGQPSLAGRSSHHQGVDRLGDGLIPVGWTGDGLVEAVEHEEGWILGVQWHPEETAEADSSQQALFDAFVDRAAGRAREGRSPAGSVRSSAGT